MSDPQTRRQRARRFERFVQVFVFALGALILGRQLFASDQTRFQRIDGHRLVLDLPIGAISDASQMSWSPSSRGNYTPEGPVVLGAEYASVEAHGASITAIAAPMRVHLEDGTRPRVTVVLGGSPSAGADRPIGVEEPLRLTHRNVVLDVVAAGRITHHADSTVVYVDGS